MQSQEPLGFNQEDQPEFLPVSLHLQKSATKKHLMSFYYPKHEGEKRPHWMAHPDDDVVESLLFWSGTTITRRLLDQKRLRTSLGKWEFLVRDQ